MFSKIKYLIILLYSYRKILITVIIFELYYSIKNLELIPITKVHNSNFGTDTIPCVYYFLFKISQFIRKKKIKSVIDLGSGYGRVTNFVSNQNKVKVQGIELNKDVYKKSLILKKPNVKLYCKNILKVNLSKFKSDCFILVDPLKKKNDKKKLINKIIKLKKKKKNIFIISVNMDQKVFTKKIKLIDSYIGSKKKSLIFYEVI